MNKVIVLILLFGFSIVSTFICQATIDTYNAHVNVGNFTGAATLTFDPSVRYIIPGPKSDCPYCDIYEGKDRVISLFVDGFLGHFTIVNPLQNLREITTDNGGPGGVPELIDLNDEAFRIKPQFGGKYFRVAVIHDFLFNSDCKIIQMHLYHDPYIAAMAFAGHSAVAVPIMPSFSMIPPQPNFVVVNPNNLLNWQVIPGEELVDPEEGFSVVMKYYQVVESQGINPQNFNSFFIALNYSIPQNLASIYVPGDSAVLPFSGLWLDQDEIITYHNTKAEKVKENSPASASFTWVANQGSIVFHWVLQGVSLSNGFNYNVDAVDYFQLIPTNDGVKIARLCRFFDTWNITLAITGGKKYPQFSNA
eukprot:TRINITY_DN5723_c0_g1_i1.p1 TRINITY_DN5723_c0_g1~~TRINITY_DN5723_c0_g1_i1.p1  ORF type:complete len:363 (+),score=51.62 TRINITY_DN5723_c0_g1_i1:20-1108(+)